MSRGARRGPLSHRQRVRSSVLRIGPRTDDADYETIVHTMELLDTRNQKQLKPVFDALNGEYDYGILKCVLAGLS